MSHLLTHARPFPSVLFLIYRTQYNGLVGTFFPNLFLVFKLRLVLGQQHRIMSPLDFRVVCRRYRDCAEDLSLTDISDSVVEIELLHILHIAIAKVDKIINERRRPVGTPPD